MRSWGTPKSRAVTAVAGIVLLASPVGRLLEASMLSHVLVQLPLLALLGWYLGKQIPERWCEVIGGWNRFGVPGLLLMSFTIVYWMLPRALDGSLTDGLITFAKFVSVPLLIGMPLAISWPQAPMVVRGLTVFELWAMLMRLGWLYLDTPVRLCSNYLLQEQVTLGIGLISLAALWVIGICGYFLFRPATGFSETSGEGLE